MNDPDAELKEYLKQVDRIAKGRSLESIVLRYGRPFPVIPKPKDVRKHKAGQCYSNAYHLAYQCNWQYVEGFALCDFGIPLQHAWAVDGNDNAVDNTWRPEGLAYFGIAIDQKMSDEILFDSRTYGILDFSKPKFRELAVKRGWLPSEMAR